MGGSARKSGGRKGREGSRGQVWWSSHRLGGELSVVVYSQTQSLFESTCNNKLTSKLQRGQSETTFNNLLPSALPALKMRSLANKWWEK